MAKVRNEIARPLSRNLAVENGSATVSVATIGVSRMVFGAWTINQKVRMFRVEVDRRDADQNARRARFPRPTE